MIGIIQPFRLDRDLSFIKFERRYETNLKKPDCGVSYVIPKLWVERFCRRCEPYLSFDRVSCQPDKSVLILPVYNRRGFIKIIRKKVAGSYWLCQIEMSNSYLGYLALH